MYLYPDGHTNEQTDKGKLICPPTLCRGGIKMNNLLHLWTKRNLTILGKILIIKSLIVPIFTYVASACVVPKKI